MYQCLQYINTLSVFPRILERHCTLALWIHKMMYTLFSCGNIALVVLESSLILHSLTWKLCVWFWRFFNGINEIIVSESPHLSWSRNSSNIQTGEIRISMVKKTHKNYGSAVISTLWLWLHKYNAFLKFLEIHLRY
jgi:hypothetical protein